MTQKGVILAPKKLQNRVISLYKSGWAIGQIEKRVNLSWLTVKKIVKVSGLTYEVRRPRKYPINWTFLETPSSDLYYILGFLMADGCIDGSSSVRINLGVKDISILYFIRDKISPKSKIQKLNRWSEKRKKYYKSCLLVINSVDLVKYLKVYGITKKKSGKEQISEQIPKDFLWHYLRGFFDGDGHVGMYKNKDSYNVSIRICSSSKEMISQIHELLQVGAIESKIIEGNPFYVWNVVGKLNVIKVGNSLYKNANFCLKRKFNTFMKVKDYILKRSEKLNNKTGKGSGKIVKKAQVIKNWNICHELAA